jgi:DNA-binding MarR family transcriptional regulator
MKKVEDRDHIDEWLETAWLQDIPNLDFAVEGIVDRMNGLTRRFKRSLNDVLAEHGLTFEEWDVLGALRRAGPPFRRSAGELAKFSELSSGAMTNRLDRLEKAGFVKRLPDPDDRRGVLIELTKAGLGEPVLLALIDVDRSVFAIDTATLKELKSAGVSDTVIVAMIRSGREPRLDAPEPIVEPMPAQQEPPPPPEDQIPIELEPMPVAAPAPVQIAVPYPVPVYVPVPVVQTRGSSRRNTVPATIQTNEGALVTARVPVPPHCVKAEPVYWGFGGKLRPGSWQPEPAVVCR